MAEFQLQVEAQHDIEKDKVEVAPRAYELLTSDDPSAYKALPDTVLSLPPQAESWSDIRRNVIFRMSVAATGQAKSEDIVAYMQEMADRLAAELQHR